MGTAAIVGLLDKKSQLYMYEWYNYLHKNIHVGPMFVYRFYVEPGELH